MAQPRVDLTILDGSLGIIPLSAGDILAVVGPCSAGPKNTPSAFARGKDIIANFKSGPAVEAACLQVQLTGKPVVIVRTDTATASAFTAIDTTGFAGTATPTISTDTAADDDYEAVVSFVVGGTVGTAGITYKTSLDNGRTFEAVAELGTATSIVIPTPAGLVQVEMQAPIAPIVTLANDLRTKFLAHIAYTTGNVHLHADPTSGVGCPAAATGLPTAITLLNFLKTAYAAHRVLVGAGVNQVHLAADNVDVVTAAVATDANTARLLANDLRTQFIAHEANTTAHTIADAFNTITAPAAGALTTGTVVAGDAVTFRTSAATWNTTNLSAAQTALSNTAQTWNIALIVGPANDVAVQTTDAWLIALKAKNKFRYAIMNTRIPLIGESEATYQASLATVFGAVSSVWVDLCAGSCKLVSAVTARSYKRPVAWIDAVQAIRLDPGQDLAQVDVGPLPVTSLTDANGNPDDHDESIFPGLDDQRFTCLRSFPGYAGVYINNGRIFSEVGSDFVFVQFRRVMNIACAALVRYLTKRLSSPVTIDKKTGFITKGCAAEINNGATQAMGAELLPKKRVTAVNYVCSLTDNILSTFTLTGDARIIPNGYVKIFSTTIGFNNPALRTAA